MAFQSPSLVHDTTNTSGTGSYALNNSSAAGRRGLADAVTDGHAANTDTIEYWVIDSTTSGGSLAFEYGLGTISGAGATLARTTIYKSSNGDAAVNWGAGGTRDVIIGLGGQNAARLNAANNFTQDQTIDSATTPNLRLRVAGNATDYTQLEANTSSLGLLEQVMATGAGAFHINVKPGDGTSAAVVRFFRNTTTSGGRTVEINKGDGTGTALIVFDAATGLGKFESLTNAAGVPYERFPSGTRLLLGNNSVPSGWSIVASLADKTILTTSTVSEIDDVGGSWTITGASTTVNGTSLTEAQLPAHNHTIATVNTTSGVVYQANAGGTLASTGAGGAWGFALATDNAGSGNTHDHTANTTFGSSWRPAYYKAGWIQKT